MRSFAAGVLLVLMSPAVAQNLSRTQPVELACAGEIQNFAQPELTRPANDIYVRIEQQSVRVVGDILSGEFPIALENESVLVFSKPPLLGNLYRYSGEISISDRPADENKVRWMFTGKCSKPKPLF
ncbi:MAG: hypothetical protein EOP84_17030 [Verrucomicrobiaceae bacterium]|nr:MAG: hypothetical protein EOP84_17030 [Verrucomicrobiaceae bacterium]